MKQIPTIAATDAAETIRTGSTVAMSGYAMAGYPKAIVHALVERKEREPAFAFSLVTGANVPWLDRILGAADMIKRRTPMIADRALASRANNGTLRYVEQQMSRMPGLLRRGAFGPIEVAIVEALGFDNDGALIPTSSVGMTHHLMNAAERIIVEINRAQPEELRGLHDVYLPLPPPKTQPIPLTRVNQRIGATAIPVDSSKIVAVVETEISERLDREPRGNDLTGRIAAHLFDFLEVEYRGWNGTLPPIQTGFGSIANSVVDAFRDGPFRELQFFCGGVTEPVMELLAAGKATALSMGGLGMSERIEEILRGTPDIADRLVIRNGDITNGAEVIGRLGLIALNTGIEIDIYGNVNSSHIAGSRVVNGIGGGAGFAQNAGLSVILIPSSAKEGAISNIVPIVSHNDIGEHDVDIVVTEHGIADLRGLDEIERAEAIIRNCSAGVYRDQLDAYLSAARTRCGGHHPQLPDEGFRWYRRLSEEGTMEEKNG
ncbi:MAG: acetyl-CoA hydrolase/transferase family protein [Alkalispirochaeta sp.]